MRLQTATQTQPRTWRPFVPRRPPGPSWTYGFANINRFQADPPAFLAEMKRTYGEVTFFRLGPLASYLISDPDLIEQVLVGQPEAFQKDAFTRDMSALLGRGLITSEGAFWKRHRKMAASPLRRKQIGTYADAMVNATQNLVGAYRRGEERNLHEDMLAVSLEIVVKTLLNVDIPERAEEVGDALDRAQSHFQKTAQTWRRFIPRWVPTSERREFRQVTQRLDDLVYGFIRQRRADPTPGDDLLYVLINARDDEGVGMTEEELRDEVLTMFLAGHETTALSLTYAIHALSQHPEALQRLRAELDGVLEGRSANAADFRSLDYTTAVIKETMRLYPPAWVIGRDAIEDLDLGGYSVPRGSQVLMSPWVVHRDARWFPEPERFDPDRWMGGLDIPRFAYFPFGGGPRTCIGNHFAMMSAVLVLATLIQNVEFELIEPQHALRFSSSVTLRPKEDVIVRVS